MDPHFVRDADEVSANLGGLNGRFAGRRILVTGAAGFLGVQFVHYFLRLNDSGGLSSPCRLVAMDNYIRGVPRWLDGLKDRSDLVLQTADIVSTRDFDRPNFIIHAASHRFTDLLSSISH
jgi:UDP-glucuronate decarboxylase